MCKREKEQGVGEGDREGAFMRHYVREWKQMRGLKDKQYTFYCNITERHQRLSE